MKQITRRAVTLTSCLALTFFVPVVSVARGEVLSPAVEVRPRASQLWSNPQSIASRDLYYGTGGRARQPGKKFIFVSEDKGGSTPKFVVRDENGVEWKVKLGHEARPEVAATRLLWAVGYHTDEDYLVPLMRVENLRGVNRGRRWINADGSIRNARLERMSPHVKWKGPWRWRDEQIEGTRELNGLRVMMALVNNWDVKDSNNAIYESAERVHPRGAYYAVSDLGSTFGQSGFALPSRRSDIQGFTQSKFITKTTSESVDFATPGRPGLLRVFALPRFIKRMQLRSIGKGVPIEDVRWIGRLLAQLSPHQIRSAFRAAGYSPAEVEMLAETIQIRISQLSRL